MGQYATRFLYPCRSMLITLAIQNYRSLLQLVMPLGSLNVITGPNGSGKSNLYRALRLLAETAQGGITRALCRSRACSGRRRFGCGSAIPRKKLRSRARG